jgi:hypothetical protein
VATQTIPGTRNAAGQHGGQRRSDAGRERDAEVAAHAIERECASAFLGVLDNHCGTDRMINRRKQAERKQRNGEQGQRRSEGRCYERNAAADIEGHHQIAPAPMIAEPSGRQREQAEGNKGGGGECDQRRIRLAIDGSEFDHNSRVNENDKMIERMGPIEKSDGEPPRGFGGTVL